MEGEALFFVGIWVAACLRVETAAGLSSVVLVALLEVAACLRVEAAGGLSSAVLMTLPENEMVLVRSARVPVVGPKTLPGNEMLSSVKSTTPRRFVAAMSLPWDAMFSSVTSMTVPVCLCVEPVYNWKYAREGQRPMLLLPGGSSSHR